MYSILRRAFTAVLFAGSVALSQDMDWQGKGVTHSTVALDSNWFVANWQIGNVRKSSPGNFNAIAGLGYRWPKAWLEIMGQRQWGQTNHWLIDLRAQAQIDTTTSVFVEVAPYLTQKATFSAIILDLRRSPRSRFSWGLESENTFKPQRTLLGGGPRISYVLFLNQSHRLSATGAYQFRISDQDFIRLYMIYQTKH
jgi:hypothetical protein